MAIGIIQLVIGCLFFLYTIMTPINSAVQQTVKAIYELQGLVLICFGILFILVSDVGKLSGIKKSIQKIEEEIKSLKQPSETEEKPSEEQK